MESNSDPDGPGMPQRRIQRRLTALAAVSALVLGAVPPAGASDPQPLEESIPSFNESPGCGALDGIRGPLAPYQGVLDPSVKLYGPWADFYGRTIGDVIDQLVPVQLPGQSKTLYVHERVLPAFESMLQNLADAAAAGKTYEIRSDTWSFNRSTIPPSRALSFHAVGAAIDVNSATNLYSADNVLVTDMPGWFVRAWTDAGWCWGGDWIHIKDAMHFSWRGPRFTPGYVMPPPQPPLVAAASFTHEFTVPVALPPETGHQQFVVDMDRDGAVDIARLEPYTADGQIGIRIARARHDHETCTLIATTAVPPTDPSREAALTDLSGDGRPDLVYLDTSGPKLSLEVFTLEHADDVDYSAWQSTAPLMPRSVVSTAVQTHGGDRYLFEDWDRDGSTDLWVIRAGDPAHLEIWTGPDFSTRTVSTDLGVPTAGHRFALGDRDFDGRTDVYALADDGTMTIHLDADGFAASAPLSTGAVPGDNAFSVRDLDGDGHPDAFLVAADGSTRVFRGGASHNDPGGWYVWTEESWHVGDGCTPGSSTPQLFAATAGDSTVAAVRDRRRAAITGFEGIGAVWERSPKGDPLGATIIPAGTPLAAVVLHRAGRNRLRFHDLATGKRVDGLGLGTHDIVDLEPYDTDGVAALTVGYATSRSRVVVKTLSGAKVTVTFPGLIGTDLAVGDDGFAILGDASGTNRVEVRSTDGSLLASMDLDPSLTPVGIVRTPGGFLVAAMAGSELIVYVTDGHLVVSGAVTIDDTGAAAVGPAAEGFVVARRILSTGAVVMELRTVDGAIVESAPLPGDYDPLALSAGDLVGIAMQRFGDGAAMITIYDGGGSPSTSSRSLP
jgi:hypothetical protein